MIKNIVFDIGGVMAYFRWKELMEDLQFSKEAIETLGEKMIMSDLWQEYNRGLMTDQEVMDQFKEMAPGYEKEIEVFFENMGESIEQFDYTQPMLEELKKRGYHLYYLTNYPDTYFRAHAKNKFFFLPLMEGGVVSAFEHMRKPEANIYELLLSRYGLDANETVFFDDMEENIEGAKAVGLHAIQFIEKNQAMEELKQLIKTQD